jgi:hypothetical protein
LIHPTNALHKEAFAPKNTVVLIEYNLKVFTTNIRSLFEKLAERNPNDWNPQELNAELKNYKLDRGDIKNYFVKVI